MVVFARSDVQNVTISPDHGGCGQLHERPVDEAGRPVAVWALTCHQGCENILRSDPLWAGTLRDVPETPDETAARQAGSEYGYRSQQQATAHALDQLSQLGDLPAALARLAEIMSGQQAEVSA